MHSISGLFAFLLRNAHTGSSESMQNVTAFPSGRFLSALLCSAQKSEKQIFPSWMVIGDKKENGWGWRRKQEANQETDLVGHTMELQASFFSYLPSTGTRPGPAPESLPSQKQLQNSLSTEATRYMSET